MDRHGEAQVDAMASRTELVIPPQHVIDERRAVMDARANTFGKREWPALLRQVERIDPGYRN